MKAEWHLDGYRWMRKYNKLLLEWSRLTTPKSCRTSGINSWQQSYWQPWLCISTNTTMLCLLWRPLVVMHIGIAAGNMEKLMIKHWLWALVCPCESYISSVPSTFTVQGDFLYITGRKKGEDSTFSSSLYLQSFFVNFLLIWRSFTSRANYHVKWWQHPSSAHWENNQRWDILPQQCDGRWWWETVPNLPHDTQGTFTTFYTYTIKIKESHSKWREKNKTIGINYSNEW